MKKTLLAFLTAGTMGCASYKTPYLPNSVSLNSNEQYIFGEVNMETRTGEYCRREILLGMNGGNLQSVVMAEYCKKLKDSEGTASAIRYKDTDNDGRAEEICEERVEVFYGFSSEILQECNSADNYSMIYLLNNALEWVLKVRDE